LLKENASTSTLLAFSNQAIRPREGYTEATSVSCVVRFASVVVAGTKSHSQTNNDAMKSNSWCRVVIRFRIIETVFSTYMSSIVSFGHQGLPPQKLADFPSLPSFSSSTSFRTLSFLTLLRGGFFISYHHLFFSLVRDINSRHSRELAAFSSRLYNSFLLPCIGDIFLLSIVFLRFDDKLPVSQLLK
jgi:hypothetical protein